MAELTERKRAKVSQVLNEWIECAWQIKLAEIVARWGTDGDRVWYPNGWASVDEARESWLRSLPPEITEAIGAPAAPLPEEQGRSTSTEPENSHGE